MSKAATETYAGGPLTAYSEDEQMFRASVREFAEGEISPRVEEMDEHAKMDARRHQTALRARADGHRDARGVRRHGRVVLHGHHRRRRTLARRPLGRRSDGRAEHARQQRAHPLGQPRAEEEVPAAARRRHRRRVRLERSRLRLRRLRACRRARSTRATTTSSPARSSGSRTASKPRSSSSSPTPNPRTATAASPPSSSRRDFEGISRRQEGEQARHPRVLDHRDHP